MMSYPAQSEVLVQILLLKVFDQLKDLQVRVEEAV